jgi:acetyl-CoA carboxylase biotin carboxylase subunit
MKSTESKSSKKFKRVLIANRGEIAIRVIRSLRELGIESVAIYAESDRHSLHASMADYAYPLQGATAAETYLNLEQIKAALRASGADALHPGYGFLSESSALIALTEACGLVFIGPSREAIAQLGDKIGARQLAQKLGIPIVAGSPGALSSETHCSQVARELGFPLILKAAAGGGGRGMRIVHSQEELAGTFAACSREALAYFGDAAVFIERYISTPRHIEVQILCDRFGHGIHLGERDCSIQRRQQKLCEEAPSTYLSPAAREEMGALAVSLACAAGFVGAGTVEFICESPEKFYFMEMNPRIQVEHTITEMITGIDLIAEQIKIAAGEALSLQQKDIVLHGVALQARINGEDPRLGFIPSSGRLGRVRFPGGPFTRVDSHIYQGYEVPTHFDSLLAKLCVWGRTREEARRRMLRCLGELELEGLATTAIFHQALLSHPLWQRGEFSTHFINDHAEYFQDWYSPAHSPAETALERSVLTAFLHQWQRQKISPPSVLKPEDLRANTPRPWTQQGRREAQERSSCR